MATPTPAGAVMNLSLDQQIAVIGVAVGIVGLVLAVLVPAIQRQVDRRDKRIEEQRQQRHQELHKQRKVAIKTSLKLLDEIEGWLTAGLGIVIAAKEIEAEMDSSVQLERMALLERQLGFWTLYKNGIFPVTVQLDPNPPDDLGAIMAPSLSASLEEYVAEVTTVVQELKHPETSEGFISSTRSEEALGAARLHIQRIRENLTNELDS